MSQVPEDLKYTRNHEWVRVEADGSVTVGITEHAQESLGDLVFVEPPEAGTQVQAEEACAVVESVKAASDVYAPISGEVTQGNEALADNPEAVNTDPYGDGWIMRIQPADTSEIDGLLDAAAYQELVADEG
ncbi:glycine cleavage system protein GcvH [Halorhodospira halophila]|uniref:Glycine cleavage system H protein n=1 Tax=Halorhodospira halophila (strain DSM 244 / SL1) TaxID=349124 RepID=GCSH_HALHL|nr:glycine cleavage system protein GcvH [Halorhodospira halophila]A1WWA4.1 RecName: Full=Glycine cleavage system H protein [Halorhodospira halophila SL1]ABM61966.1 glycine cleavage system H protein [Halorhodospira halophila SL1]MBK1729706.1 glycine cleavage system protein H [Halorhodospira halophila]